MGHSLVARLRRLPGLRELVSTVRLRVRVAATSILLRRLQPRLSDRGLIRFGPAGDGGYVIPDDLEGIQACFSPGVSGVSGFEKDCADRGMKVFLADASVDGPAESHPSFHFVKAFVSGQPRDGFLPFAEWVSASVGNGPSDLMLQMDIEGAEYEVLASISDALMCRFRIIVIEFHGLDGLLAVWSRKYREILSVFNRLLRTHSCVHIHPNNCSELLRLGGLEIPGVMEFTFLRNDRLRSSGYQSCFPHPLDAENTKAPPLVLPPCWYRQPSGR